MGVPGDGVDGISTTHAKAYSVEEQENMPALAGPEIAWATQPPACPASVGVKADG
jgi:hypothetical protein